MICAASLAGGCLPVLVPILLLPITFLGTLFTLDEISNEKLIQAVPSPNGRQVAEVYFRPVGAYSGGNGRVIVRISYRVVPLLERDLFFVGRSQANEDTHDYVAWRNDSTLFVTETQTTLGVWPVQLETPEFARLPMAIVSIGAAFAQDAPARAADAALRESVRRVPMIPATITRDSIDGDSHREIAWRSFQVTGSPPDEVIAWYRATFSVPPWSLTRANHFDFRDWHHDCLRALLVNGDGKGEVYFVSVSRSTTEPQTVFVEVSTPHPPSDLCGRFDQAMPANSH